MKRHAWIPSAPVPLEERVVLSQGAAGAVMPAAILREARVLVLNGFAVGLDKTTGPVHRLGPVHASIAPLGPGQLSGFLVIPTMGGPNRAARGVVTISGAHGAVVVSIKGTVTILMGTTMSSGRLTYKIVSGTGAYRGATGTGPVLYGPGPVFQPGRFLLDFGNAPPPP